MVQITHNPNRQLIHLVTAGSVDDGKSTLIGRLLYDSQAIYEDQLGSIEKASQQRGFKDDLDYSLLTDGLSAEREQGITIDVAYRYFSTPNRRFVVADVPGHEQYTRNMITGASKADLALILVDARKGLLTQSKRHLFIASLLSIPHIAVVINKMDLVNFDQSVYENIKQEFINFSAKMSLKDIEFIPTAAPSGDMIVERGTNMPWYGGHTVFNYIDTLEISTDRNLIDFRFPIQNVIRPNQDFRGYCGKVEGGVIKIGEEVLVLPSKKRTKIKSIIYDNSEQNYAFNPQSIVLSTTDELDASRGEMIVREKNLPEISNELDAMICWFSDEPLDIKREYLIKHTTKTSRCSFDEIIYRLNINTLHREKSDKITLNDIARIHVVTNESLYFDPYIRNRNTGSFIIIDPLTNNTVGAGIIQKSRKHSTNGEQLKKKNNEGAVVWFTGLSGSGKSTVADKVYKILKKKNIPVERLDGDEVRKTLTKDLGFSKEDRDENINRISYVAKLLSKHGVIVLASFISPYKKQRAKVKKEVNNFVEVFVNAPLDICKKRDVKGHYKNAKSGKVKKFTGVSDPYEKPSNPDLEINTDAETVDESVEKVMTYLRKINLIEISHND